LQLYNQLFINSLSEIRALTKWNTKQADFDHREEKRREERFGSKL
jgi:hypothetical protein